MTYNFGSHITEYTYQVYVEKTNICFLKIFQEFFKTKLINISVIIPLHSVRKFLNTKGPTQHIKKLVLYSDFCLELSRSRNSDQSTSWVPDESWPDFKQGKEICFFSRMSRPFYTAS